MTAPTNEQQRADVLAVTEDAARLLYLNAADERAECEARDACDALLAAKKAVAELIEAVEASLPHLFAEADRYLDDGQNEPLEAYRKLRTALANVGAQK